jgi:hypothetical protein
VAELHTEPRIKLVRKVAAALLEEPARVALETVAMRRQIPAREAVAPVPALHRVLGRAVAPAHT